MKGLFISRHCASDAGFLCLLEKAALSSEV